MEGTRKRGRPRKVQNIDFDSDPKSKIEELEIDSTDFNFYQPDNFESPSVEQFNPLADAPIKRDYSSPKIQEGIVGDIVEPTFHQPSFTSAPPPNPNGTPNGNPMGGQGAPTMANPALNQMDAADKKVACEQMVDAALDVYETLWALGGKFAQVSEESLQRMVNDGTLNPKRQIPVQDTSVSIFEFFEDYNQQVVEASKVDTSFKKKVRPPMIRVFMKHGWGMTDEQFLGIAFAKDSIMRGVTLFQMKRSINALINQLAEEKSSDSNDAPSRPRQSAPTPTPPPQPQPAIIIPEVEEVTDDELEAEEEMPKPIITEKEGVEKLKINFDDNPLRQDTRREPPAPKVEEKFVQGGEIKDDLSL